LHKWGVSMSLPSRGLKNRSRFGKGSHHPECDMSPWSIFFAGEHEVYYVQKIYRVAQP
jgi:hypothetical protein